MGESRAFALSTKSAPWLIGAVFLLLLPSRALALLNLEGTRNQLFVFGEFQLGYDSNIYAQNGGEGDTVANTTAGIEYKRNAGIIGVDANASITYVAYDKFSDQDTWNPSFSVSLEKTTGRTTGSFTARAYRTLRADAAVNELTDSWNFPLELDLKYPINQRYYFTSETGYVRHDYLNNPSLSDYDEFSQGVDLFYVYTSKLDLLGGYRVRISHTDAGRATDQDVSVGATGGLLPKVSGLVRAGIQNRSLEDSSGNFNEFFLLGELTWTPTRKFTVVGQASQDFNTTATTESVNSLAGSLQGTYVFTRRFQAESAVRMGRNVFLNGSEFGRRDEFFGWDAGVTYTWNEHLKVGVTYTYLHNRSNFVFSDFDRNGFFLDIGSRF
jgi:Putative beta-barrel porin 2